MTCQLDTRRNPADEAVPLLSAGLSMIESGHPRKLIPMVKDCSVARMASMRLVRLTEGAGASHALDLARPFPCSHAHVFRGLTNCVLTGTTNIDCCAGDTGFALTS